MKKYEVFVKIYQVYRVEIEAIDEKEATNKAIEEYKKEGDQCDYGEEIENIYELDEDK